MYHENKNVNLIVENVPLYVHSTCSFCSLCGLTLYVHMSAKMLENNMYAKKIIFQILMHVLAKIVNIQKILLVIQ